MPLNAEQLETQRRYIHNNPRSRMQRASNRAWLQTQRGSMPTALSLSGLKGYLKRECTPSQFDEERWARVKGWLMTGGNEVGFVVCDGYGNVGLMRGRLLPVVCHRKDAPLLPR